MIKQLPEAYNKINNFIVDNYDEYNTPETRSLIEHMLWQEFPHMTDSIICNETNNTEEDVNDNIVNVKFKFYKQFGGDLYYIDLKFGDTEITFS